MERNEEDSSFEDAMKLLHDHFEGLRKPSLYDRICEVLLLYVEDSVDTDVLVDRLTDEVGGWLPKEDDSNPWHWNSCLKSLRKRLR